MATLDQTLTLAEKFNEMNKNLFRKQKSEIEDILTKLQHNLITSIPTDESHDPSILNNNNTTIKRKSVAHIRKISQTELPKHLLSDLEMESQQVKRQSLKVNLPPKSTVSPQKEIGPVRHFVITEQLKLYFMNQSAAHQEDLQAFGLEDDPFEHYLHHITKRIIP